VVAPTSDWEKALWAELEGLTPEGKIVATGEWIARITRTVLPELGNVRRGAVLDCLARTGWDATLLAETIGSRRTTITRLAEEGRARERRRSR
jgi:hypothetical protein